MSDQIELQSESSLQIPDQTAAKIAADYEAIAKRVAKSDRKYFKRHPLIGMFTRPYVPGEAWPHTVVADTVHVVYTGDYHPLRGFVNGKTFEIVLSGQTQRIMYFPAGWEMFLPRRSRYSYAARIFGVYDHRPE